MARARGDYTGSALANQETFASTQQTSGEENNAEELITRRSRHNSEAEMNGIKRKRFFNIEDFVLKKPRRDEEEPPTRDTRQRTTSESSEGSNWLVPDSSGEESNYSVAASDVEESDLAGELSEAELTPSSSDESDQQEINLRPKKRPVRTRLSSASTLCSTSVRSMAEDTNNWEYQEDAQLTDDDDDSDYFSRPMAEVDKGQSDSDSYESLSLAEAKVSKSIRKKIKKLCPMELKVDILRLTDEQIAKGLSGICTEPPMVKKSSKHKSIAAIKKKNEKILEKRRRKDAEKKIKTFKKKISSIVDTDDEDEEPTMPRIMVNINKDSTMTYQSDRVHFAHGNNTPRKPPNFMRKSDFVKKPSTKQYPSTRPVVDKLVIDKQFLKRQSITCGPSNVGESILEEQHPSEQENPPVSVNTEENVQEENLSEDEEVAHYSEVGQKIDVEEVSESKSVKQAVKSKRKRKAKGGRTHFGDRKKKRTNARARTSASNVIKRKLPTPKPTDKSFNVVENTITSERIQMKLINSDLLKDSARQEQNASDGDCVSQRCLPYTNKRDVTLIKENKNEMPNSKKLACVLLIPLDNLICQDAGSMSASKVEKLTRDYERTYSLSSRKTSECQSEEEGGESTPYEDRHIASPVDLEIDDCSDFTVEISEDKENKTIIDDNRSNIQRANKRKSSSEGDEKQAAKRKQRSSKSKSTEERKKKSFTCHICRMEFSMRFHLKIHRNKIHDKERDTKCSMCPESAPAFETFEALQVHLLSHTSEDHLDAEKRKKQEELDKVQREAAEKAKKTSNETQVVERPKNIVLPTTRKVQPVVQDNEPVQVVLCPCHANETSSADKTMNVEMVWVCNTCQVLFRREACYQIHFRDNTLCRRSEVNNKPKLYCSKCENKVFSSLPAMKAHLKNHCAATPDASVTFLCNICNIVFYGVGKYFNTHWDDHMKKNDFIATQHSFPSDRVLTAENCPSNVWTKQKYILVTEFVCKICGLMFNCEQDHDFHKLICNKELREDYFQQKQWTFYCTICNCPYESFDSYNKHSRIHNRYRYLDFNENINLFCVTIEVPVKGRAFVCNLCTTTCTSKKQMEEHWLKHAMLVEYFSCSQCSRKLSSFAEFKKHYAISHPKCLIDDTSIYCEVIFEEAKYTCRICESRFDTEIILKEHAGMHRRQLPANQEVFVYSSNNKVWVAKEAKKQPLAPKPVAVITPAIVRTAPKPVQAPPAVELITIDDEDESNAPPPPMELRDNGASVAPQQQKSPSKQQENIPPAIKVSPQQQKSPPKQRESDPSSERQVPRISVATNLMAEPREENEEDKEQRRLQQIMQEFQLHKKNSRSSKSIESVLGENGTSAATSTTESETPGQQQQSATTSEQPKTGFLRVKAFAKFHEPPMEKSSSTNVNSQDPMQSNQPTLFFGGQPDLNSALIVNTNQVQNHSGAQSTIKQLPQLLSRKPGPASTMRNVDPRVRGPTSGIKIVRTESLSNRQPINNRAVIASGSVIRRDNYTAGGLVIHRQPQQQQVIQQQRPVSQQSIRIAPNVVVPAHGGRPVPPLSLQQTKNQFNLKVNVNINQPVQANQNHQGLQYAQNRAMQQIVNPQQSQHARPPPPAYPNSNGTAGVPVISRVPSTSTANQVISQPSSSTAANPPLHNCQYCGKGFYDADKLKIHEEAHVKLTTGLQEIESPQVVSVYICPKCNDVFLNEHERNVHLQLCVPPRNAY